MRTNDVLVGNLSAYGLAREYGTPLYVYDLDTIRTNVRTMKDAISYRPLSIHFACMSNANTVLLSRIRELGLGVFVCTLSELELVQRVGFDPKEIVVTGCNFSRDDIEHIAETGVTVNADSVQQVTEFVPHANLCRLGLRVALDINVPSTTLNPGVGPQCRLGIPECRIQEAIGLAELVLKGLHTYVGTNMLDHTYFARAVERLLGIGESIKTLQYIDIGGGFGIPYGPTDPQFDWFAFGQTVTESMQRFSSKMGRRIELTLEPGRSVVGSSGLLLARVVEVKRQNDCVFVGTDTSMSNFVRPFMYNQYHDVTLLTADNRRPLEKSVFLTGNTGVSQDFLARGISLPHAEEGDVIAISNTGAYGFSTSSHFCGCLRPAEILVEGDIATLIRSRETVDDLLHGQVGLDLNGHEPRRFSTHGTASTSVT